MWILTLFIRPICFQAICKNKIPRRFVTHEVEGSYQNVEAYAG